MILLGRYFKRLPERQSFELVKAAELNALPVHSWSAESFTCETVRQALLDTTAGPPLLARLLGSPVSAILLVQLLRSQGGHGAGEVPLPGPFTFSQALPLEVAGLLVIHPNRLRVWLSAEIATGFALGALSMERGRSAK